MSTGETRVIADDIFAGGVAIFGKGEQVAIESVDPNPQSPEHQYVVYSRLAGKWFQLRAQDFEGAGAFAAPGAPGAEGQQQYFAPGDAFQQGVTSQDQGPQYVAASDATFQRPYGSQAGYTVARKPSVDETKLMGLCIGTAVAGFLVMVITFLPWVSHGGSGWDAMLHGVGGLFKLGGLGVFGGFSVVIHGEGALVFTGFWSLLSGAAIVVGGAMLIRKIHDGVWVARIAALVGWLCALITMMTMWFNGLGVGIGLYMFLFMTLAGTITSQYAHRMMR